MKSWPLLLLLVGCQGYESGAKEEFSRKFTCPADRVEARERKDIKVSDVKFRTFKDAPPPEIAKDPARRAMWQAEQDKSRASIDSMCEIWEAKGCSHATLLCCSRSQKHADRVNCNAEDYPAGQTAWQ